MHDSGFAPIMFARERGRVSEGCVREKGISFPSIVLI